jgi:transcription elongation factor Elf1
MPNLADQIGKSSVPISCPGCGHQITTTLAEIDAKDHLTCGGCGARVNLEKSGFTSEMDKVRRSAADLDKALKDFGRGFK